MAEAPGAWASRTGRMTACQAGSSKEHIYPMSPSNVIAQPERDVLPIEQKLSRLFPLQHAFAAWHTRPMHQRIAFHAASHSAAQTQAVLPPGALVEKTVTVDMAGKLLLCTCVGDQKLESTHLRAVAHALALPRRTAKHWSINPSTCDPVVEYGMLPGMVSPFVSPLRKTRVATVVLLPWSRRWEEQGREVAVSLSLWKSLLLPLRCLRDNVCGYARRAYPSAQLIELEREENHGNQ